MRRLIRRATILAILSSTLLTVVPVAVVVAWISTQRADLVGAWLNRSTPVRVLDVLAVSLAIVVVGTAVALAVAGTATRTVAQPLEALMTNAERLGEGEGHLVATESGIDEVDRISRVLVQSAQQLARSITSERSFASDASHQLRTPLTALLMRLEEIAATDDIEVAREEAAVAISQVERLSRVVDELLQRRRSVPETARPEVVLDSVLASLQREWQPAFETARRSIRVHGERGLSVRATPIALSQVFSTLLENSLVHGRGTVEIQVRRSGPSVVVEVCDEGDGVSATMAPHIFERSVSSGAGGTGLGLALARDLAESFGGRLELIARTPATFAVFLSEASSRFPARIKGR